MKSSKANKLSFTAIYEKRGKWFVGYVEEIPGVNTQGHSLAETKRNLREALELILETNRILARSDIQSISAIRESITVNS